MIIAPTIEETLLALYTAKKAVPREVNLFGLRDPLRQREDVFNDRFGIWIPNRNIVMLTASTTDPGVKATNEKEGGAAHLDAGYQPRIWCVDTHAADIPSFAHKAFCSRQSKGCLPTRIWRDRDRDTMLTDKDVFETGYFGVNGHRASAQRDEKTIGLYSYGCQVVQNKADFDEILKAAIEAAGSIDYKYDYMILMREELWVEAA